MKQIFLLILCLCGTMLSSQNTNHPTIDKVQAAYKAVPQPQGASLAPGAAPDLRVKPEVVITIKAGTTASKVYLKMQDTQSHILYQVNYQVNASPVTDGQGNKLFYREGNALHIGSPNTVSLMPYQFEVYTEDSQGNASPVFSVTQ